MEPGPGDDAASERRPYGSSGYLVRALEPVFEHYLRGDWVVPGSGVAVSKH
jgi:hypothetical protein